MSDIDIDGLDEFVHGGAEPTMVMGITPQQQARPAFTLSRMPPRVREKTIMVAQREDPEDDKSKLIGYKPVVIQEKVEGGYMLRAMKGHSIFIEDMAHLRSLKLGDYVNMINTNDADGTPVAVVPVSAVVQPARKAA